MDEGTSQAAQPQTEMSIERRAVITEILSLAMTILRGKEQGSTAIAHLLRNRAGLLYTGQSQLITANDQQIKTALGIT